MSLSKNLIKQLPEGVSPEAICLLDEVLGHRPVMDKDAVSTAVFEHLESRFQDDALDEELERLHLAKMSDMGAAIDAYDRLRRKHPNTRFAEERIRGAGRDVTDVILYIIDTIVRDGRATDRFSILSAVCDSIQKKYGCGDSLDLHLQQMHIMSTKDILYAIDIYFTMKELYPDLAFGRQRLRDAWKDAI